MKKYNIIFKKLLLIVSCAIVQSCLYGQPVNNKPISFTIEGKIADINGNATIWLGMVEPYEYKGMAFKGDVKNGAFVINGQTFQKTIGLLSLFLLGPDGKALKIFPETPKLEFFLCEGKTTVFISDSFNTIRVDCGCKNDQVKFEVLKKDLQTLENEIQRKSEEQLKAKQTGDTVALRSVSKEIKLLNAKIKLLIKRTILKYKNSYLSLVLLKNSVTGVFTFAEAEPIFNKLNNNLKNSLMGIELQRQFDLEKTPANTLVGKKLIDFVAEDSLGAKRNISSFSGKWILLDFWASWCGPCREAHPRMKELYSNFGNEKFEIISVSIDKDRKRWLKAIADDKLNWPQLIDSTDADKPSGYGRGYQSYKGKAIPLSFLISPEQIITDINLSITELALRLKRIYSFSKTK